MKKFAVIFGGESSEHDISVKSATSFIKYLPHDIEQYLIYIDLHGNFHLYENGKLEPIILSPNKKDHGILIVSRNYELVHIDEAIVIMHGKNGEDGTIQGLLKLAGIPLIGTGIIGSALCMDKYLAHKIAKSEGIKCAESILLHKIEDLDHIDAIQYPVFVKPVKAGSSIGISKVENQIDLPRAVREAFSYDDEVLIEQAINGVEVGVAILKGEKCLIGEVDEVEASHAFFDFEDKYQSDTSKVYLPARFDEALRKEIQKTALKLFEILKCEHFARIDLFIDENHEIYFNEINSIPGLTDHSRFPAMMNSIGIDFESLVKHMVHIND